MGQRAHWGENSLEMFQLYLVIIFFFTLLFQVKLLRSSGVYPFDGGGDSDDYSQHPNSAQAHGQAFIIPKTSLGSRQYSQIRKLSLGEGNFFFSWINLDLNPSLAGLTICVLNHSSKLASFFTKRYKTVECSRESTRREKRN